MTVKNLKDIIESIKDDSLPVYLKADSELYPADKASESFVFGPDMSMLCFMVYTEEEE